MELIAGTGKNLVSKLLLSFLVSSVLLSLLIRFILNSADATVWPNLTAVLVNFSLTSVFIYTVASLARTLLQAIRYRLLISAAESNCPSLFHIFAVTLSRNMFVDMLPARLGELSYIAMLNRGYQVSVRACISSLAVSFIFDLIGLAVIIAGLICFQFSGGSFQGWTAGLLIVLVLLILVLIFLLYPFLRIINRTLKRIPSNKTRLFAKVIKLFVNIEEALRATREKGILLPLFGLSLTIRILKYFSLFILFSGVVSARFPQMTTDILTVLPALISAEAGASLPVPAFLGFGTYEAGGTLALIALGASKTTSLVIMLALHIISQAIDYVLGSVGVILFIFKTSAKTKIQNLANKRRRWLFWAITLVLLTAAASFLLLELTAITKRGALTPPPAGKAVIGIPNGITPIASQLDGFIVWSSNRSGNHDIYLYSLPDKTIKQITTHPHTDYFPRISPDGNRIVFARSQTPWVSQRNYQAWDIWLLDLTTGKETHLADNGNTPTWSSSGEKIYFQRNTNLVVEFDLTTKTEKNIFESGKTIPIPETTVLETPNISSRKRRLAVTLRKTMRATAVVTKSGNITQTGNGCQLTWGPDDRYLYKIDHGGKMQNAVFKIDPQTGHAELWFDAPGDYSHEYFPASQATTPSSFMEQAKVAMLMTPQTMKYFSGK